MNSELEIITGLEERIGKRIRNTELEESGSGLF